ncbi:MAG: DUF5312 domain-containing protein [Spirochaetaceae bacterium]|jgi:hypothetical protein|nr:DUF5312 domain-containing protein [Spirochaetaceae bacterium]
MQDSGTFTRLSRGLEHDEKQRLLEKLKSNTIIQDEIIQPELVDRDERDIEALYSKLPWYRKLLFFLLGFFTGKQKEELFLNHLINKLWHEIEAQHQGMYDGQNNLLLSGFLRELTELREAARFFSSVLNSGILANYGMFLIYLGSLEMPEVHERLQKAANPALLFSENPHLSDIKLKKVALNDAENTIAVIEDEKRSVMYNNARSLFCLKELAFFLFDRLILGFQGGGHAHGNEQICPFSVAKAQLVALNSLIFSFKRMPSMSLLSSMYVFVMQNEHNGEELGNEREMQRFTAGAEKALFTIRSFAAKVPLTRILRCGMKDLAYEPVETAGSEEWFSLFREKWLSVITENFNEFILTRKKNELTTALSDYFNGEELEKIENIRSEEQPDGIPVKGALMLSFLNTFHKRIYMGDMNNILRPVLIDGEFYKRENRIAFTEAYNELLKVYDLINAIEKKLRGEWDKQWRQINADIQSVAIKHRKMSLFMEEINLSVDQIIQTSKNSLVVLQNVIGGIIQPDTGGKYDTLSNMAKISGKGTEFAEGLHLTLRNLKTAVRLVNNIEQLDTTE